MNPSGVIVVLVTLWCSALASGAKEIGPTRLNRERLSIQSKFTFNNHTYAISSFAEYWSHSVYYCKWLGMELVSIETPEEQQAIVDNLGAIENRFWTSLSYHFEYDAYLWESTGEVVGPYSNWEDGQPPTGSGCMALSHLPGRDWKLTQCSMTIRYICESRC